MILARKVLQTRLPTRARLFPPHVHPRTTLIQPALSRRLRAKPSTPRQAGHLATAPATVAGPSVPKYLAVRSASRVSLVRAFYLREPSDLAQTLESELGISRHQKDAQQGKLQALAKVFDHKKLSLAASSA
jgi:hypothetical protein